MYAFIRKKAKIEEYEFLKGEELKKWILKKVLKNGGSITKSALNLLYEYIGSDLWRQKNEIQKLIAYKNEIEEEDVKFLVNVNSELNIFNTVDAISKNDKKNAIKLAKKHLEKGESIFGLLALIGTQFKNMLIVKTLDDYRKASLHPFVLRKSYYQSQKFSVEDLKRIHNKILEIDSKIKTGELDEKIAMETLILEI